MKELRDELQDLLAMLNAEEYPETFDYLASLLADEDSDLPDSDNLVIALRLCDKALPMPRFIFDFVVEQYEEMIENGNSNAMNDLGALYYDGRGCEQDFTKAVYYYQMAAEQGNRQAQENLGYCYYYGRNIPVDYEKAFHYFALGAFDGHLISLYKIGDMYQNGYYVKKNLKEAFYIYERCIDTMTEEASKEVAGPVYLRLGKCFLNGLGTEQDAKTALICYQRAELYLYDMVKNGDYIYEKSLKAAIDGQEKARKQLQEMLPDKEWDE